MSRAENCGSIRLLYLKVMWGGKKSGIKKVENRVCVGTAMSQPASFHKAL